jgi:hypothetical protein
MNVVFAVGEVVFRSARAGIEVGRARARLADPAGVGLRRDGVSEVLEAVQDVHRAVLDAVLVSGDQAAADPAGKGVLACVVEEVGAAVQPFDHSLGDGAVVAEPYRAGDHKDVGGQHLLVEPWPGVGSGTVLGHVRPHPGGDVMIDGPDRFQLDTLLAHDPGADIDQPLGVAELR